MKLYIMTSAIVKGDRQERFSILNGNWAHLVQVPNMSLVVAQYLNIFETMEAIL